MLASVAFGDFCLDKPGGVRIHVALQGDQINVNVSATDSWVGIGVPKSVSFDEMANGNFIVGGQGNVHDRSNSKAYNDRPDTHVSTVIPGTGSASTVNGVTTLSFSRKLAPSGAGLIAIDATKPFRLLWAHGTISPPGTSLDTFNYHGNNRGSFMVDLVHGNCASAVVPVVPPATKPTTTTNTTNTTAGSSHNATVPPAGKGKNGKKAKAKGKAVCNVNQTLCTKAMQAQGNNCVLGKCVKKAT